MANDPTDTRNRTRPGVYEPAAYGDDLADDYDSLYPADRLDTPNASERMVAVMRAKALPADIPVQIGDYVSARMRTKFSVVAIVQDNVFDPRGMSVQLALFENAARHLEPAGYFVVEAFLLDDIVRDGEWHLQRRDLGVMVSP